MKRFGVLFAVVMLVATPLIAQNFDGFKKVDPNDQAAIALLSMVLSDLNMCGRSLNKSVGDTVSAVGHLNNAQSALKRSQIDPAYSTLLSEIHTRISKIKFYVVMNDVDAAAMRLQQLIGVIRSVLGNENAGNIPNYGGSYGSFGSNNGQINNPIPSRPSEIPVGQSGQVGAPPMGGISLPATH